MQILQSRSASASTVTCRATRSQLARISTTVQPQQPSLNGVTAPSLPQNTVRSVPAQRVELQQISSASSSYQEQPAPLLAPSQEVTSLSSSSNDSIINLGLASALALFGTLATAHPAMALSMSNLTLSIPGIVGDDPIREGFVSGFLLIFFSEIGDKTFFIALLLALKQPKTSVFVGTFSALAIMTVISVALGQVIHQVDELLPQSSGPKIPFDDLLAAALLIFFGVKTLQDAQNASATAAEEKEEAEEVVKTVGSDTTLALILSTFALVFAAEWGDKSFLATIALAAASSPMGVVGGAIVGHGVATGIAVAGGSVLGKYFDEKVLQYVGGSLFLVFAASTVLDIYVEMSPQ